GLPRPGARHLPPGGGSASRLPRSPLTSTGRATSSMEPLVGVGRSIFTAYSAVTVHGGVSAFARRMRWYAAVQLEWQSRSVPAIAPETAPSDASWNFSACRVPPAAAPLTRL